jgi:formamidopyrimidine-DNA glycosylase
VPELPEVETVIRTLSPHVRGRRIIGTEILSPRACPDKLPDLTGCSVRRVHRYGKYVVLALDFGFLVVDLRMTGLLLWRASDGPHTRARIRFSEGTLLFNDIRQFGSIRWQDTFPNHLGPDPLEISEEEFAVNLRDPRRLLKPLLTDQRFLRGLGNICADEILFRAGIDPRATASTITRRAGALHRAMRETLLDAIEAGGSTIRDFRDANGQTGRFQLLHRVYGRTGKPCPACGSPIARIVVGQRGTHYCPRCQRR